jgi:hypothetical protein
MRIRIIRRCRAPLDGFSTAPLEIGRVCDAKDSIGTNLIAQNVQSPINTPSDSPIYSSLAQPTLIAWMDERPIAASPLRSCRHNITSM